MSDTNSSKGGSIVLGPAKVPEWEAAKKTYRPPEQVEESPVGVYQKIYTVQRFMNRVPKNGSSTHSRYATITATIDALFPLLHKYELVCTSESNVSVKDAHVLYTFTTRITDIITGEHVDSTHLFDATQLAKSRDAGDYAQRVGALETYYRRYSLYSIFNMITYDADGQPSNKREQTVKPQNYMKQ